MPTPRCGGCGAGWRSFGEKVGKLCEYDGPEPGHAKLARLIEEREREQEAARARAKEMAIEEERQALEWQKELQAIVQQREGMADEELEQDCLSNFACAEVLLNNNNNNSQATLTNSNSVSFSEGGDSPTVTALDSASRANLVVDNEADLEGPPPPRGPLERWLEELFGGPGAGSGSASSSPRTPRATAASFGELPVASLEGLAERLREALAREAKEAEEAAREADGRPLAEASGLSEALDRLLQKYAAEEAEIADGPDAKIVPSTVTETESSLDVYQARATHHRAVGGRLTALLPCLAEDVATTRLVSALSVLDIGSVGAPYAVADCTGVGFRAPLRALSTSDVCWALCSEKRRLVVDSLLPAVLTEGRWSWHELRRTGLGWWLCGTGTEVLDTVVTKLAQSAVSQLKAASAKQPMLFRTESGAGSTKRLADEALFWYVLSGTKLARLRQLLKTGLLSGEPALARLLEHPRSGQADFVRKNAFRLLQLHRYHLAAALFVLCESYEEAAMIVAGHLRDLQLMLVLARHLHAVRQKLVRERLVESPLADRDPWLRLLLTWHTGDRDAALRCAQEPREQAKELEMEGEAPLFDGALRLSARQDGLQEVGRLLLERSRGG